MQVEIRKIGYQLRRGIAERALEVNTLSAFLSM